MLDPEPGKGVRRLQAAGPDTDDDDQILAGRETGDAVAPVPCRHGASLGKEDVAVVATRGRDDLYVRQAGASGSRR